MYDKAVGFEELPIFLPSKIFHLIFILMKYSAKLICCYPGEALRDDPNDGYEETRLKSDITAWFGLNSKRVC